MTTRAQTIGTGKQSRYRRQRAELDSNLIYFVAFKCTTFGERFIFTKIQNIAKWFFDICNTEMAQWRQKS